MKTQKHQQTVIDFTTQSKNALLDRVRFRRGCGANQSTLKSILRSIHRFAPVGGWCFVGVRRLAEQAGVSVSTVRRGMSIMVGMGLVSEQRKAKSAPGLGFKFDYRWQICWGQLQGYVDNLQAEDRQQWLDALNGGDWRDSVGSVRHGTIQDRCQEDDQEECQEGFTDGDREGDKEGDKEEALATDGRMDARSDARAEVDPVKRRVGEILRDTSVVDKARRAGASDALIMEVVAVYLANRLRPENRWGPEALHYRLRVLRPGQAAVEGWFKGNRVSSPEVMQAAQALRSREQEQCDEVSQRIQLIKYGRKRGASNEEINRALAKRGWELLPVFDQPVSCVGVG